MGAVGQARQQPEGRVPSVGTCAMGCIDRGVNPVPPVLQAREQGWAHPKDDPVAGQGCHTRRVPGGLSSTRLVAWPEGLGTRPLFLVTKTGFWTCWQSNAPLAHGFACSLGEGI